MQTVLVDFHRGLLAIISDGGWPIYILFFLLFFTQLLCFDLLHILSLKKKELQGRKISAGANTAQHVVSDKGWVESTEHKIKFLLAMISVCPLLGLLGTIIGIMEVFSLIGSSSIPNTSMGGGISQALLTTQLGMAIAIPGSIFMFFLKQKLSLTKISMDEYVTMCQLEGYRS